MMYLEVTTATTNTYKTDKKGKYVPFLMSQFVVNNFEPVCSSFQEGRQLVVNIFQLPRQPTHEDSND